MGDTDIIIQRRHRGRPPKNKTNIKKFYLNPNIEENLILRIPYFSKKYRINFFKNKLNEEFDKLDSKLNNLDDNYLEEFKEKDIKYSIKDKKIVYLESIKSIAKPFDINENNEIIIPKFTDICCCYDAQPINSKPFFLPEKYDNGLFYIIGWFCSLNCAIAYNNKLKDNKASVRLSLLKQLYNVNKYLTPAPNILNIKTFGGSYDINDFRSLTDINYKNKITSCNCIENNKINNNVIENNKTPIGEKIEINQSNKIEKVENKTDDKKSIAKTKKATTKKSTAKTKKATTKKSTKK